jgi:hypothetical protein
MTTIPYAMRWQDCFPSTLPEVIALITFTLSNAASRFLFDSHTKVTPMNFPSLSFPIEKRHQFALVAGGCAAAVGVIFVYLRWRAHKSDCDVGDAVDFVDHREAAFSLFRRDVLERMEGIERRLENLRCAVCGSPKCRPTASNNVAEGDFRLEEERDIASVHDDESDATRPTGDSQENDNHHKGSVIPVSKATAFQLLETDDLLTKLMVYIDGAPVAGLEHLRTERKALLGRALACGEELAKLNKIVKIGGVS